MPATIRSQRSSIGSTRPLSKPRCGWSCMQSRHWTTASCSSSTDLGALAGARVDLVDALVVHLHLEVLSTSSGSSAARREFRRSPPCLLRIRRPKVGACDDRRTKPRFRTSARSDDGRTKPSSSSGRSPDHRTKLHRNTPCTSRRSGRGWPNRSHAIDACPTPCPSPAQVVGRSGRRARPAGARPLATARGARGLGSRAGADRGMGGRDPDPGVARQRLSITATTASAKPI